MSESQLDLLVRRLRNVAELRDDSAALLRKLPHHVVELGADHLLYEAGRSNLPCYVLVEGCVTRFKLRTDGSRAIVAFELPGDIINYETLLLNRVDCGATITVRSKVAIVEHAAMNQAREKDRNLEVTLWRYALVKAAALEEWLLNVGRRSPTGRLAHLLVELHLRLIAVGSSRDYASELHVSPEDLADAMGLQQVIVTRSLHELASQNIVELTEGMTILRDLDRLAGIAEFRSDYLHMAS